MTTQKNPSDDALMRDVLSRIATGPELSKDISREEACAAMRLVLDGNTDPVRAGIFLIALRMKRETNDETCGVLDALREATTTTIAAVDELIDVADPYDGFNRSLPAGPFLPAVLAACGVPTVSHGVESMPPKHGVTHRQILRAAGVEIDLHPNDAAARIADKSIGWAYVDQRAFCPKLYALTMLREQIVKRPVLTTVETLLGPIRGRKRTHLYTGYVHKNYPPIYAAAARASGFDSALIVRGIEGGVIPSLRQEGKLFYYRDGGTEQEQPLPPADFGFTNGLQPTPIVSTDSAAMAKEIADAGVQALAGGKGWMRDNLISATAIALWQLQRAASFAAGAELAQGALDSGAALERFKKR